MFFSQLCGRVKILALAIIGIFRRALCCFSRRRKPSLTDTEVLQCVNVVTDYSPQRRVEHREKDWNSWDDSPQSVEEHIENYRQKLVKPPTPKQEEPEPDFFRDMTPKIKPQAKVFVGPRPEEKTDFSRLEAKTDIPIAVVADLEDWSEEDPGGWEELDSEKTKQLIREKRKELRNQKQNKPKEGPRNPHQVFAEKITRTS